MAVVSFRTPHEGIEKLETALGLMSLIREIATNPSMGKTIEELSSKLTNAQQLSDAQKEEVFEAQETIARAKEALEDLEEAKRIHDQKVSTDIDSISQSKETLRLEAANFEADKIKMKNTLEKALAESNEKLDSAAEILKEANLQYTETKKLETALSDRENSYNELVADLEKSHLAKTLELDDAVAQHKKDVALFEEDQKKLELRKQRFEDALKA